MDDLYAEPPFCPVFPSTEPVCACTESDAYRAVLVEVEQRALLPDDLRARLVAALKLRGAR